MDVMMSLNPCDVDVDDENRHEWIDPRCVIGLLGNDFHRNPNKTRSSSLVLIVVVFIVSIDEIFPTDFHDILAPMPASCRDCTS
jgi:hypothetical protein